MKKSTDRSTCKSTGLLLKHLSPALRMHVYIHDMNLVLVILDQPPVFSSQTLQDAVKGSDGLKQERTSGRSGSGCAKGFLLHRLGPFPIQTSLNTPQRSKAFIGS